MTAIGSCEQRKFKATVFLLIHANGERVVCKNSNMVAYLILQSPPFRTPSSNPCFSLPCISTDVTAHYLPPIRCKSINGVTAYGQNITTATTGRYLYTNVAISLDPTRKNAGGWKNSHHNSAGNTSSWGFPSRRWRASRSCGSGGLSELLDGRSLESGACECRHNRGSERCHNCGLERCVV